MFTGLCASFHEVIWLPFKIWTSIGQTAAGFFFNKECSHNCNTFTFLSCLLPTLIFPPFNFLYFPGRSIWNSVSAPPACSTYARRYHFHYTSNMGTIWANSSFFPRTFRGKLTDAFILPWTHSETILSEKRICFIVVCCYAVLKLFLFVQVNNKKNSIVAFSCHVTAHRAARPNTKINDTFIWAIPSSKDTTYN